MEELSYTSKFDGETTDDILRYANEGKTEKVNEYVKSMNVQDSKGEPDTVQVYDTDGVPHKVSKTELLKKSTLALPKLEDISSFVAINAAGNAVGVMTKEDIASVLAGLIGINNSWIRYRGLLNNNSNIDDIIESGIYRIGPDVPNIPGYNYGILLVISSESKYNGIAQLYISHSNEGIYHRVCYDERWCDWSN